MKIAYNPKTAAALISAPANNDITFDLSGLSIYVKGVRLKGTDTTYNVFKKHGPEGSGGYDGLVPVPNYNNNSQNRYLREDGTWWYATDVKQSEATDTDFRPIVLGLTHSTTLTELVNPVTGQVYVTSKIYACPSTGILYATKLYSNGKEVLTEHQSLENYVTLNTPQTITGRKTFYSQVNITNGTTNDDGTQYTRPIIQMDSSNNMIYSDTKSHTIILGSTIKIQTSNDVETVNILPDTITTLAKIESSQTIKGTQLISTETTKSPLEVSSSMLVTKLNSDLLDNYHASELFEKLENNGNNLSITIGGTNKDLIVNYATSTTKVIVNQHTTNNIEYPLIWSNQNNTNTVTENQLYKSYSHLTYNPSVHRISTGQYVANNSTGPHFTANSTEGNWSYLRLNNGSTYWDIATKSNSESGGLWLARLSGADNGIFVSTVNNVGISTPSPTDKLHVNGGNIKITNNGKYLKIGPQNSSYAHYETDASHWFNTRVDVDGAIWRYNTNYGISSDGYFYAKGVYANRDGSTTLGGVSLYSNSDPMTYGMAFRGTGTYGKHGGITGDQATYFTMNDDTSRGWIFRRGSTNVVSIAGSGLINTNNAVVVGKDLYYADGRYGLQLNNSDVVGANAIYFNDLVNNVDEGIHFYRSATTWDTLTAANGLLYFCPNREITTNIFTPLFSNLDNSGNNISITVGGQNRTLTVAYATNATSATKLQTARNIWGQLFDGSNNVAGNMYDVGQITFLPLSGTDGRALLFQPMADNDFFRIYVGSTASNSGYAEIATSDDGNEPIYVRQYSDVFNTIKRTLTLLDKNGNTSFPGLITTNGDIHITHDTTGTMTNTTTNPKLIFSENGVQKVGLVYTNFNSYRSSKGLKVMDVDGNDDGNVWLEAQGYMYSSGFCKNGSSDSYVLLGGGGHKLESNLSIAYANSAGTATNADTVDGYHATTFTKGDSTHPVVIASGWIKNNGAGTWSWGGGCIRSGVTISVSRNGARLEVVANGAAVTSAHANQENSKSIYGSETSNKTGRSQGMYWLTTYCTGSTVYIKAAAQGNAENDTWWSDSDMLINGTGCISTITITLFGYVY